MGEFVMPSLGSQMEDATLIQWLVKPGDRISKGDIIGEIHTEKGDIDVEALESGIVRELRVQEGDTIPVGTVMAVIDSEKGLPPEHKAVEPESERKVEKEVSDERESELAPPRPGPPRPGTERQEPPPRPGPNGAGPKRVKASPLAKRVAEELKVNLEEVTGSGPGGTIHKKDVETAAKEREDGKRPVPFDKESMRRAIAAVMSQSNREIPHYYLEKDIDMKAVTEWLEEENSSRKVKERLMPPVLMIKAVANALAEVPELNGYWNDGRLQVQESIHIGFTISLRRGGLVIPALMNADIKSLDEIREEFVDMVMRAREGRLKTGEIGSATFTITSLGERGAEKVFGVIYPPQVGLVGFGNIIQRPWSSDGMIGIRPVMSAVLAGDHRATDGHSGSRFLEILYKELQQPHNLSHQTPVS